MREAASYIAEAISEYLAEPRRGHLLDEIRSYRTLEHANEELRRLTGVRHFFPDGQALAEFRRALSLPAVGITSHRNREWGDFQTPPKLASQICNYLTNLGIAPRIIIEPTYGAGHFILAALNSFPKAELVYGVEIQKKYEWHLKLALLTQALGGRRPSAEVELHQDDIFTHRFPDEIFRGHQILIIGNPPWVTNAELGALDSRNLPTKSNLKALNGLDAVTGKSNFDIGEFILLRLLEVFSGQRGTLALLCKTAVIKNIIEALPQRSLRVSNIRALTIDTKREFGASVEAALVVADMGMPGSTRSCHVATLDHPDRETRVFGWTGNRFVSDLEKYQRTSQIDGPSPLVWRQGLKHDCSKIMELDYRDGSWINGNGELVDVEEPWVHWLLKGSDLREFEVHRARKKVIVTQHYLGENTSHLKINAPKLWQYLVSHGKYLAARKSSMYRGRPRFSIFGIGDYSFTPYKVAISGLYKQPRFSLVLPIDGRPVMLDDTCYFLGFAMYLEALFTATLLNSDLVGQFLESVIFADAKRPYTKDILMRIDLNQVACRFSFDELRSGWLSIGLEPKIPVTASDYEEYKNRLSSLHRGQRALPLGLEREGGIGYACVMKD
jgi:hypothetical protein